MQRESGREEHDGEGEGVTGACGSSRLGSVLRPVETVEEAPGKRVYPSKETGAPSLTLFALPYVVRCENYGALG